MTRLFITAAVLNMAAAFEAGFIRNQDFPVIEARNRTTKKDLTTSVGPFNGCQL
jgi:hypothetical protein